MRIHLCAAALLILSACQASTADVTTSDPFGEEELAGDDTMVATGELGSCFCPAPFTCQHSSSPSRMFPGAHAAMLRAGVTDASLIQTFGDAPASVGTHCPEPGVGWSAATDVSSGSNPCARVHALRMEGFAAWSRTPPSFSTHIHMVYAGTPSLKSSLKSQLNSFAVGRNGLANNEVETRCPITQAERAAVNAVRNGGTPPPPGACVPGGFYCGGDKVTGNANTLYRCNADAKTATVVRACAHGCSVNAGDDDSCRCSAGGAYCGGDQITGNSSTLYRCGSNGVSTTVIARCARGCSVNSGRDDSCK